MTTTKLIQKIMEKKEKEFMASLEQSNKLSLWLMKKKREELVGIIMGILMGNQL